MYNKFIAEGDKVCSELIKNSKYNIDKIFILDSTIQQYKDILSLKGLEFHAVSIKEMAQITAFKTASDILMLLDKKEDPDNIMLNINSSAIYMDGIQDPGNVGTIIRLADWFGIDAVIRSEESADFFNPKVIQATMGSIVNVSLITADYTKLLAYKKTLVGTFMNGSDISETAIPPNAILVLGNEGKGISGELAEKINHRISIIGSETRIAESLNVSIAAGIICHKWKSK